MSVALIAAVLLLAGIILGTLGALIGLLRRGWGRFAWRALVVFVAAKIGSFKAESQAAARYLPRKSSLPAE